MHTPPVMRRTFTLSSLFALGLTALSLFSPAHAEAQLTHRDRPRTRVGIEAGAGPNPGVADGASAGLYGQLGVQIDRRWALYYQPSLQLHVTGLSASQRTFAGSDHLLMSDITVGPFQFGLGAGMSATPRTPCQGSASCATDSVTLHPLVGGRIAAVITVPGVRARWGVPIAANLHVADPVSGDRSATLVFTIGVQRF